MDLTDDKKPRGQKRTGLPFLTAEDILNVGKICSKEESPINLSFDTMKDVRMSPIEWENFEVTPKLMKISNSGTTAILSAKWNGPRPYLANGPVSGKYVFSQLHFHWGRSFQEGSEHRVNGESLPLEMHAMFFKNVYLCQDEAMKKSDGIITLAYFFLLQEEDNENLSPITDILSNIVVPLSSQHIEAVPLKTILPPFSSDYFLYWGNVVDMKVLWIICRIPQSISKKQLKLFQKMIGLDRKAIEKNFREPKELNNRMVFHVNPSENKLHPLLPLKYSEPKKSSIVHKVYNATTVYPKVEDDAEYEMCNNMFTIRDHNFGYGSQRGATSLRIGDIVDTNDSTTKLIDLSLKKKTNIKDLKYTLAKMLLELEKREDNDDYGVLENYLKVKYKLAHDKFQAEKRVANDNREVSKQHNEELQLKASHISNSTEIKDSHPQNHVNNNEYNTLFENSLSDLTENRSTSKHTLRNHKNEETSQEQDSHDYDNDTEQPQDSDTASTRRSSSYSERSSDQRRCKSASENRNSIQMGIKSINKFGIKSSGFIRNQDSQQVRINRQSLGEMRQNNIHMVESCELKGKITVLETKKSDEFSLLTSEVMSSDSEKTKQLSNRITSSDEMICGNKKAPKTRKEYDIQALKERLLSRRLKRNIPSVRTAEGGTLKRAISPRNKEEVEKSDNNSIMSKTTEDEERSRKRAMIRKSMMRIMKDRTDGKETLPKKPKTPDRPAWKP